MDWIKLLLGAVAVSGAVGGAVALYKWNKKRVAEELRRKIEELRMKNAFRAKILEAQKHAIKCGIFDDEDFSLGCIDLQNKSGFSEEIKVGTEIILK